MLGGLHINAGKCEASAKLHECFEYCPWDGFDQHRTCTDAFVPQANKGEYSQSTTQGYKRNAVGLRFVRPIAGQTQN